MLARAAKARGLALSEMLGWAPSETHTPQPDGTVLVTRTSVWDYTERVFAQAVDEIDRMTCQGCGGDLNVELTTDAPWDDDGDGHYHRIHMAWCRGCRDISRAREPWEKAAREHAGTPADPHIGAMRFVAERLPIPAQT